MRPRAALAFDAALKELAFVLDPSLEIRIELASGTEGSLSLNSIIRALKQAAPSTPTVRAVVATVLIWFAADARTFGIIEALRAVTGIGSTTHLSDEEKKTLAEMVAKAIQEGIAQQHLNEVYRELEHDPAIKGVGSTIEPGRKPDNIVPRAQFPARAGIATPAEITVEKRIIRSEVRLTLVSPVLLPSDTRVWRFMSPLGSISAHMKDLRFLERLLSGQERVPMRANIEMDVILETAEEKREGVWTPVGRDILEVRHIHKPTRQPSLDLFSKPAVENDGEDQQ